jgi:HD-GYP domain-containing protein (c-di-GMP phosphodiesterase class II)
MVQTLLKELESRDFISQGHTIHLAHMISDFGLSLGLNPKALTNLRLLAEFHDIGKVGIPEHILSKVGALTDEERTEIRRHCEIGHRIAMYSPELLNVADWILKHHEYWNGNGYPLGLEGEGIPLECRMFSIVEAYEVMTNDRPYRRAMSHSAALAEINRCSGSQFDPELVKAFLQFTENFAG